MAEGCRLSCCKGWSITFHNLYSFYRFMPVMSCREGSAGEWAELFQHESAALAHMAILLGG